MEFVKQREIQTKEITNNADQTDIVGRLCETPFRSPASAAADTLQLCALLECKVQFF